MPLLTLWNSNKSAIGELTIEQVVATAGDGNLRDDSSCPQELREYFSQIPSKKLSSYVDHCLSASFNKSGFVLQDLINELGRRLDYTVRNGLYQGKSNAVGFDGIWSSPEGNALITEVKTTDAYRISLDTIARYRERLGADGTIKGASSVLIVVGREDTGELEAQIRGSRHAWDIRLISADALMKLVSLKENSDAPETGRKIRSVLTPMEYTRVDEMIDVMFTTATDVEAGIAESTTAANATAEPTLTTSPAEKPKGVWEFTDSALLEAKRDQIVTAVARGLGTTLIKKSRALYWDAEHNKRVGITISKRYSERANAYWYAYHPQWDDFLRDGTTSQFVLGCMDLPVAFSIPWKTFRLALDDLNTTTTERGIYWHVHISETKPGVYEIPLPKKAGRLAINEFRVNLD